MERTPSHSRAKELAYIVSLIFCILGVLVPAGFRINDLINKPDLTYEQSGHSLSAQKSLVSIVVRNEGRASAKQVEVTAKVNGEIENIVVSPGDIAGKIPWFEVPGEFADTDIIKDLSGKDSLGKIKIPYIAKRTKYTMDLWVKPQGDKLIQSLIVQCVNNGLAKEYVERSGSSLKELLTGFAAGVILTLASVFLSKSIRRYQQKGQESPKNRT